MQGGKFYPAYSNAGYLLFWKPETRKGGREIRGNFDKN